jgi:GalNAc-alpha-(1->4)-GalNAc-alpha-(1->3)-diNAcBac-PP-undecaprenol alpha-1,4-N-acetyl-D-galactosaminyltransferase
MNVNLRQKRIALVIAHLGAGGAQRVVTTAANALVERGIDVHVVTIFNEPPDAYDLDPRVRRHRTSTPSFPARVNRKTKTENGITASPAVPMAKPELLVRMSGRLGGLAAFGLSLARRSHWLRKTLRGIEPDAVLSFLTQTNILTLLATRGLSVRTVVSERNDPRRQNHRQRVIFMRKMIYRWSDVVTANSLGAVDALGDFVPKKKLAFLPNPLSLDERAEPATFAAPTFITVTRLVEQKGLDVLLRAAACAFESLPGWRLAIVGDGPLRAELQALADELGIAQRIDWLGQVSNPAVYLKGAKFFVLTSRFEGSPNALLEAMACGLPAVVSDASPGPLELIGGDDDAGLIVPVEGVEATGAAIVRLADDPALRERLGQAAMARTEIHKLDRAMEVWLELLKCA